MSSVPPAGPRKGPLVAAGPPAPGPAAPGRPAPGPEHRVPRTRTSGAWTAAAVGALVLLVLLIFILENGRRVPVVFFGARAHLPLGVGLLLAAVAGALLVILLGGARILQLRRVARRHREADAPAR